METRPLQYFLGPQQTLTSPSKTMCISAGTPFSVPAVFFLLHYDGHALKAMLLSDSELKGGGMKHEEKIEQQRFCADILCSGAAASSGVISPAAYHVSEALRFQPQHFQVSQSSVP